MYFRKKCIKPFIYMLLVTVTLLVGCQKKALLPQPEFPLSEETLTAALDETGLLWSVEQADELSDGTTAATTYTLHRPEDQVDYNGVFINSYDSETFGRRLHIFFREPQNKQYWLEEDDACWEDWKDILALIARLYGGFEDAEDIYQACSAEEFPKDEHLLWQGELSGGYFLMMTEKPMKPERLSRGNSVFFYLYESEDAYLAERSADGEHRANSIR